MSEHLKPPDRATAKALAKRLRQCLVSEGNFVTHSEALELTAKQFGFRDWNTMSARISAAPKPLYRVGGRISGEYLGHGFSGEIRSVSQIGENYRLSIHLDTPVDVVEFESFSAFRQRVSGIVQPDGVSPQANSKGVPHLRLAI